MNGPLCGLKILDFSTLLPGPYASMLLADMGAQVCRVVSPDRPDLVEQVAPFLGTGKDQQSFAHLSLNRNKKNIALDLKRPQSVAVIKRMILDYDIVLEQFRPGVMARMGLDYATLSGINPALIYCSISGYGQTGPCKDKAGHDINYLALSGLASYSGSKETGPVLSATQIADIAGGSHHAVMAILAAVIERQSGAQGQWLDISMTDSAFSLNALFGAGAVGSGQDPEYSGTTLNGGSFYGYYRTRDQRYLAVGALEAKFARSFFTLIERSQWFEHSQQQDHKVQQALKMNLAGLFLEQDLAFWLTLFAGQEVCVEPVLSVNEAANSPLLQARNMLVDVEFDGQQVRQIAAAVKFANKPNYHAARTLGADTLSVLKSLGYNDAEISQICSTSPTAE